MKETEIQRACLEWLQLKGYFCWRNNNTGIYDPSKKIYRSFHGMKGVPDIIVIMPPRGTFVGVEVKGPTGRQSDAQKAFEASCVDSGGVYVLVHSLEELIDDFDELDTLLSQQHGADD